MTHIASHPPSEDSYISASPLYRMFGYLNIEGERPFKVFFLNNTGYQFKPGVTVGFHLSLFELSPELAKLSKKKFCGIAHDLVEYKFHEEAEKSVMNSMNGGKIEDVKIEFIESFMATTLKGVLTAKKEAERRILVQTCNYMRTDSFKHIYPAYKTGVSDWIRKNVADLEFTKTRIFGCGSGENEPVQSGEFEKLFKQFSYPAKNGKAQSPKQTRQTSSAKLST